MTLALIFIAIIFIAFTLPIFFEIFKIGITNLFYFVGIIIKCIFKFIVLFTPLNEIKNIEEYDCMFLFDDQEEETK